MSTAVEDRLIRHNPCQIKGASVERSPERPVLSIDQIYTLAAGMPDRLLSTKNLTPCAGAAVPVPERPRLRSAEPR